MGIGHVTVQVEVGAACGERREGGRAGGRDAPAA